VLEEHLGADVVEQVMAQTRTASERRHARVRISGQNDRRVAELFWGSLEVRAGGERSCDVSKVAQADRRGPGFDDEVAEPARRYVGSRVEQPPSGLVNR
jgi:hypothetical protein